MKSKFDKIKNVEDIYLGAATLLTELKKVDLGKNIILPDSEEGQMKEIDDEYLVIVKTGKDVPKDFKPGKIILGINGHGYNKFVHNKKTYILLPVLAVSLMTEPSNFNVK